MSTRFNLVSVGFSGLLALASVAVAARADDKELSDAQVLEVANLANDGEVQQASYAQMHAQAGAVKAFADLMVKDHTNAKKQGIAITKDTGIRPAPSDVSKNLRKDSEDVMKDLKKADADDFDKTYMKAQVKEHEQVLKILDDELIPSASAASLKQLLADMKTHVTHHLAVARGTVDKLK
ncbi:MAG TPA: DUF4142 domain-containing protein [Polyangiaceae bacterium]|nr:DUF4142 domain-containing protein [Polyangiaceae bacterium]